MLKLSIANEPAGLKGKDGEVAAHRGLYKRGPGTSSKKKKSGRRAPERKKSQFQRNLC